MIRAFLVFVALCTSAVFAANHQIGGTAPATPEILKEREQLVAFLRTLCLEPGI